jgi:Flp pilus assembly protein TadG
MSAIRRFARARTGATVVEFALVAAPFAALLVAIVQTAVVYLAQEVLQTATEQAARLIMTGQAQTSGMTQNQFKQNICGHAAALFSCFNLQVQVQTFANFSSVTMTNPVINGQLSAASLPYNPGHNGDIIVVQSYYAWPVVLGPLGFNLSNLNNNKLLLVGTAVFRNEPY